MFGKLGQRARIAGKKTVRGVKKAYAGATSSMQGTASNIGQGINDFNTNNPGLAKKVGLGAAGVAGLGAAGLAAGAFMKRRSRKRAEAEAAANAPQTRRQRVAGAARAGMQRVRSGVNRIRNRG